MIVILEDREGCTLMREAPYIDVRPVEGTEGHFEIIIEGNPLAGEPGHSDDPEGEGWLHQYFYVGATERFAEAKIVVDGTLLMQMREAG